MKLEFPNRLVIGILVGGALFVVLLVLFVPTVPPRSRTHGTMHMIKRRMLRYAAAHGALPTSPNQLPCIEGFGNEVRDGWGRPLRWRIDEDEVTLIS